MTVIKDEEWTQPDLWDPDNLTVTYSSSDPSVATVDANTGIVTLIAAGTTTITATFAGWTPTIVAVTADATYTATYN